MLTEFREFLEKFNVLPIAIGLVLALAFEKVTGATVGVIMTIIAKAFGAEGTEDENGVVQPFNFDDWAPGDIPVGSLIGATVSFVLIAFVVFLIVKAITKAGARTTPAQTPDQALLTEIRDLLRDGR